MNILQRHQEIFDALAGNDGDEVVVDVPFVHDFGAEMVMIMNYLMKNIFEFEEANGDCKVS